MARRKRRALAPPDLSNEAVAYRPVATADFDAVAQVWLDSFLSIGIPMDAPPEFHQLRTRIADEIACDWDVTIALVAERVVGFVALNRSAGVVEQLFIAPEFQRRGIGADLLRQASEKLTAGFTLWTHADNHRARGFYEKAGMRLLGPGLHPRHGYPIARFVMGSS